MWNNSRPYSKWRERYSDNDSDDMIWYERYSDNDSDDMIWYERYNDDDSDVKWE